MKWNKIDLTSAWHRDDPDDIYKLIVEIHQDWLTIERQVELRNHRGNDYEHFFNRVIHDGNSNNGVLYSYKTNYEKYHEFYLNTPIVRSLQSIWGVLQKQLDYIRTAEFIVDMLEG